MLHVQIRAWLVSVGSGVLVYCIFAVAKRRTPRIAWQVFAGSLLISTAANFYMWSIGCFPEPYREAVSYGLVVGHAVILGELLEKRFTPR